MKTLHSKTNRISFILIILGLFISTTTLGQITNKEKQALIDLYDSTQGDTWINPWNLEAPVAQWEGVILQDTHVVSITLTNNNLTGAIPSSIKNLTHLKVLNLHNNKISGHIPESIGNLNHLKSLNLSLNELQGNIPENITQLSNLAYLDLFFNKLTGELPTEIGALKNLKRCTAYGNKLTGTIPASIYSLKNITYINLTQNNIDGVLVQDIATLKKLDLDQQHFERDIPKSTIKLVRDPFKGLTVVPEQQDDMLTIK